VNFAAQGMIIGRLNHSSPTSQTPSVRMIQTSDGPNLRPEVAVHCREKGLAPGVPGRARTRLTQSGRTISSLPKRPPPASPSATRPGPLIKRKPKDPVPTHLIEGCLAATGLKSRPW
jgi:hypothetical protein